MRLARERSFPQEGVQGIPAPSPQVGRRRVWPLRRETVPRRQRSTCLDSTPEAFGKILPCESGGVPEGPRVSPESRLGQEGERRV